MVEDGLHIVEIDGGCELKREESMHVVQHHLLQQPGLILRPAKVQYNHAHPACASMSVLPADKETGRQA